MDVESYLRHVKMLELRNELFNIEAEMFYDGSGFTVDEVIKMMNQAILEVRHNI